MGYLNKAMIIGNLGADPDIRYMPSGGAVANLSIATTEKWKDKQSGEMKEKTEWHKVSLFNRLAEIAGEYLSKGSSVYIEGRLQTRKWQDKEGHDRWTTEIVGDRLQMLSSKNGGGQQQPRGESAPEQGNLPSDVEDDDIPF